jgi:hypothetical protein
MSLFWCDKCLLFYDRHAFAMVCTNLQWFAMICNDLQIGVSPLLRSGCKSGWDLEIVPTVNERNEVSTIRSSFWLL